MNKKTIIISVIIIIVFVGLVYYFTYTNQPQSDDIPEEYEKEFKISINIEGGAEEVYLATSLNKISDHSTEFKILDRKGQGYWSTEKYTFTLKYDRGKFTIKDNEERYFIVRMKIFGQIKNQPGIMIDTIMPSDTFVNVYYSKNPWIEIRYDYYGNITSLQIHTEFD